MDTRGTQSPSTLTSGVPAQSGRPLPDENTAPAAPPTCYQHTERECHVRCTRCDRFICPSCMLSAAVGFQCPDCVRTGHEGTREARTVFGGRISNGAPVVSLLLVVINLAVFVAELKVPALAHRFSMASRNIVLANGHEVPLPLNFPFLPPGTHLTGVAAGEWYRLLTAAFVHPLPSSKGPFAFAQLVCNLAWLWKLGPQLEDQLGRTRYLALYLLCAVGGSVAVYVLSPNRPSSAPRPPYSACSPRTTR